MGELKGKPELEASVDKSMREGFPKWGFALIALLGLMFSANGALVWLSSQSRHDLVRKDYYDAGLDQDGVIARNALANGPGMEIALHRDAGEWRVESGSGLAGNPSCRIRLYRPDDDRRDTILSLKVALPGASGTHAWSVPSPVLRKGFWLARIVWEDNGRPVMEKTFRIFAGE